MNAETILSFHSKIQKLLEETISELKKSISEKEKNFSSENLKSMCEEFLHHTIKNYNELYRFPNLKYSIREIDNGIKIGDDIVCYPEEIQREIQKETEIISLKHTLTLFEEQGYDIIKDILLHNKED